MSRSGRHEHTATTEYGVRREGPTYRLRDLMGLEHPARSLALPYRQRAFGRTGDPISQMVSDMAQIPLDLRMREHAVIHRGTQYDGCAGREEGRAYQVVGTPLGGPSDEVGRRRRDADGIRIAAEPDVERRTFNREEVREGTSAGHTLERERGYELLSRPRENHIDLGSEPGQITRQLDRLVCGDSARNPEHDPSALPGPTRSERSTGQEKPSPAT